MIKQEKWEDIIECNINFSEYTPISVGNSLHICKKEYLIDGVRYRLLYATENNEPLIQQIYDTTRNT